MKLDERQKLHAMSVAELEHELATAERQLLDYRFDAGLNRLTNPAGMHKARKMIATVRTLIREKELMSEHGFATIAEYRVFRHEELKAHRARKRAGQGAGR